MTKGGLAGMTKGARMFRACALTLFQRAWAGVAWGGGVRDPGGLGMRRRARLHAFPLVAGVPPSSDFWLPRLGLVAGALCPVTRKPRDHRTAAASTSACPHWRHGRMLGRWIPANYRREGLPGELVAARSGGRMSVNGAAECWEDGFPLETCGNDRRGERREGRKG